MCKTKKMENKQNTKKTNIKNKSNNTKIDTKSSLLLFVVVLPQLHIFALAIVMKSMRNNAAFFL